MTRLVGLLATWLLVAGAALAADSRTAVLLGLTGAGKSTTGNTLCSANGFLEGDDSGSVTKESDTCSTASPSGSSWTVIDTPGFFDTGRDHEDVLNALARFTSLSPRGVDAFLLLVPCPTGAGRRFTDENNRVFQVVEQMFQRRVFKHALMVFNDCGSKTAEQLTKKMESDASTPATLRHWLKSVDGRMVALGDKDDATRRASDREALFSAMERIVAVVGGQPYENSLFKAAQEQREKAREESKKMEAKYQEKFKKLEQERDAGRINAAQFEATFQKLKEQERRAQEEQQEQERLRAENALLQQMRDDHAQEIAALQEKMEHIRQTSANDKEMFSKMLEEIRAVSQQPQAGSQETIGASILGTILGGLMMAGASAFLR